MRKIAAILLAICLSSAARAEQRLFMLDFVFLNKSMELKARNAYNSRAAPIAARHGVKLQATLDPVLVVLGPRDLDRLDLWTLPAPESLRAWGQDPDYKAMHAETMAVHDMSRLTLYLGREMGPFQLKPGVHYWVEFLSFDKDGFNGREFTDYQREVDGIAAKSGLHRVATFGKVGRIMGQGYEAHWMNIYSIADGEKLQGHLRGDRFVELAPVRERLFKLDRSIMGVFQSR